MWVESPVLRALSVGEERPTFSQDCFHFAAKYSLMPSTETNLETSTKAGLCAKTTAPWHLCFTQIHPANAECVQVFRSWQIQHGKCSYGKKRDVDLNCTRPPAAQMGALTMRLIGKRWAARTGEGCGWIVALWDKVLRWADICITAEL